MKEQEPDTDISILRQNGYELNLKRKTKSSTLFFFPTLLNFLNVKSSIVFFLILLHTFIVIQLKLKDLHSISLLQVINLTRFYFSHGYYVYRLILITICSYLPYQ